MNPLAESLNGTLYDQECNFLMPVKYIKHDSESATFLFFEEPKADFPERVFLMPEGEAYDYTAYLYTLSKERTVQQDEDGVYYLVGASTKDIPESRQNFRVNIAFQVLARFDGYSEEIPITIRDIGIGGFLFVADRRFPPGARLSFIFSHIKNPVIVTAKVCKLRPVRAKGCYGHGCQFVNLPPSAESAICNFVFEEEALQARKRRNM